MAVVRLSHLGIIGPPFPQCTGPFRNPLYTRGILALGRLDRRFFRADGPIVSPALTGSGHHANKEPNQSPVLQNVVHRGPDWDLVLVIALVTLAVSCSSGAARNRKGPIRTPALKRPTMKSAENRECDSHADQETSEDSEPYDHKALTSVGVAARNGRPKTVSKKA